MSRGEPTKTIAHARAAGEKALTVHSLSCYYQAVKTFEELKLWNDMIFVDIPKHRRLCARNAMGRNVRVMPIFPPAKGTPRRVSEGKLIVQGEAIHVTGIKKQSYRSRSSGATSFDAVSSSDG